MIILENDDITVDYVSIICNVISPWVSPLNRQLLGMQLSGNLSPELGRLSYMKIL